MEKILIIEDNEEMLENTAELLELGHYKVYTAGSVETGVCLAATYLPDLILCEEMLRGGAFRTFIEAAQKDQRISHIPIVIMSGNGVGTSADQGEAAGRLRKPFSDVQLYTIVDNTLRVHPEKPHE